VKFFLMLNAEAAFTGKTLIVLTRENWNIYTSFKMSLVLHTIFTTMASILLQARCNRKKTSCDKVCEWLATAWWFSPDTPVSTNKTDRHELTEILLKVALKTITLNPSYCVRTFIRGFKFPWISKFVVSYLA
jgi:hypothetical protein